MVEQESRSSKKAFIAKIIIAILIVSFIIIRAFLEPTKSFDLFSIYNRILWSIIIILLEMLTGVLMGSLVSSHDNPLFFGILAFVMLLLTAGPYLLYFLPIYSREIMVLFYSSDITAVLFGICLVLFIKGCVRQKQADKILNQKL